MRFLALLLACLTVCSVLDTARAEAAQVAASIEYTFVSRPAGLPDDMQTLPGATLRFLSIKTLDASTVPAALWQPAGKAPATTTIFVQVHGSGANFTELPLRSI